MATVTVVDNADGTVTATISGSSGGSNVIYTATWDGGDNINQVSPTSWTNSGSRVGDGTINITLTAGYYWCVVITTSGGDDTASLPVYFRASNGQEAIHYQILQAIQARIRSLTLAPIDTDTLDTIQSEAIVIGKTRPIRKDRAGTEWSFENQATPGVVICPYGREDADRDAGTNIRDDIVYRTLVAIIDEDYDWEENLRTYLKWREQIARSLRNVRLSGITGTGCEVYLTHAQGPLDVIDESEWVNQRFVSGYIINTESRESRGLT
jgi:hypothetical protein